MATNTEEIVVKFRTEGGQEVEETFRKAADAGEQFHQKITKAGSALGDLRLKSEARVANNIGAIAQSMLGGASAADVLATAITKVSESFRGKLLYAAAATTGAVLYEGIVKAGEAIIKLDTQISDLKRESLVGGDLLGTDRINRNLDKSIDLYRTLNQTITSINVTSGILKNPFLQALPFGVGSTIQTAAAGAGLVSGFFGGKQEEVQKTALRQIGQITDIRQEENTALDQTIRGDERLAAAAKIRADTLQRTFAIEEKAAAVNKANSEEANLAVAAEKVYGEYQQQQSDQLFTLKEKQVALEKKIGDTQKELLEPADENLQILQQRIDATRELLGMNLNDQAKDELRAQLGILEATKQRAEFTRQFQRDLSGLELGRVRGGVGSNRARIEAAQTRAQFAATQGTNTPEFQAAEAGLEEEQFQQFEQYQRDPAAFRQKRINEQHERERFQFLKNTGQLPSDIATSPIQQRQAGLTKDIQDLITVLKGLPKAVGVT